jgi:cytochrome c-type biogenesis protein
VETPELTLSIAFLAGLLSFASPCVLPLVPAYVGYLGGTTVLSGQQEGAQHETAMSFLHSLLFVAGFGLVFVMLGASATFIGRFVFDSRFLLQRVGGVLLVVFGMRLTGIGWSQRRWIAAAILVGVATFLLNSGLLSGGASDLGSYATIWLAESVMMGVVVLAGADLGRVRQVALAVVAGILNFLASYSYDFLLPNLLASVLITLATIFLNRADFFYGERKIELKQSDQVGYLRSLLFGVVFAAGWTPCIGPILTGILVVASQLDTVGQGMLLLTSYTLGLGVPFLLVGLALGPMSRWLRRLNRHLGLVSLISGVLLVLMGILIFTDSLAFLAQYGSFLETDL